MRSWICCRLQIFISAAVQPWVTLLGHGERGCFWWGGVPSAHPGTWVSAGWWRQDGEKSPGCCVVQRRHLLFKEQMLQPRIEGTWHLAAGRTRFLFRNSSHHCWWQITTKLNKGNSYFSRCPLPFPPVNSKGLYVNVSIVLIFLFSSFIFEGIIVSANSFDLLFRESTCSKSQHWILNDDCLQWISS